jgi:hypothetical protein
MGLTRVFIPCDPNDPLVERSSRALYETIDCKFIEVEPEVLEALLLHLLRRRGLKRVMLSVDGYFGCLLVKVLIKIHRQTPEYVDIKARSTGISPLDRAVMTLLGAWSDPENICSIITDLSLLSDISVLNGEPNGAMRPPLITLITQVDLSVFAYGRMIPHVWSMLDAMLSRCYDDGSGLLLNATYPIRPHLDANNNLWMGKTAIEFIQLRKKASKTPRHVELYAQIDAKIIAVQARQSRYRTMLPVTISTQLQTICSLATLHANDLSRIVAAYVLVLPVPVSS